MNGRKPTGRWNFDRILNQLIVVVAIGVIGHLSYALYANDRESLGMLLHFNPWWMAAAFAIMASVWLFHGGELFVWGRLFRRDLDYHGSVRVAMSVNLGAAVTPTVVGGGPFKLSMLMKRGFAAGEATTILAMNPLCEALFYAWFIPMSVYLGRRRYDTGWLMDQFSQSSVLRPFLLFFGIVLVFALLRFCWKRMRSGRGGGSKEGGRWSRFLVSIGENMSFIATRGRWHFAMVAVLVSMKRLVRYAALVALVHALGLEADLIVIFLFQWVVYISMMYFPTPGASGGAELMFHTVFKNAIPMIDITMMGWRFLTYYFLMVAAAGYLLLYRWRKGSIV